MAERLEGDCLAAIIVGAQPERMMRALHGQHGGTSGKTLVEDVDLRIRIAAELERQQSEQDRLAGPGRPDDQHMTDIADMRGQAERGRAAGLGIKERRAVKVGVMRRPGPYRRQRHEVRQIQRMDDGLADIGVNMAGQRTQPGFHRIDALTDGREPEPVDDALNRPNLLLDAGAVGIGNRDRGREVPERDMIAAQCLQGQVGIDHLVVGVAIEKLDRLVVDDLAQERGDGLPLVKPLAPEPGQRLGRVGLVERDEARHPAIAERLVIERVQNPRTAEVREAEDGQGAKVLLAELRLQAPCQRGIDEQPIQIDGGLGDGNSMSAVGDRAVQKGQGLGVVERANLRHETGEQVECPVGLRDESGQSLPPVAALHVVAALDQGAARTVHLIGRRQEGEGQIIAALEMLPGALECGAALLVHQPRCGFGKDALGIAQRVAPLGLEVQRPAGAEPLQHIVRPRAGGDQLRLGGAFEVGTAEAQDAHEAAVLVQHHARCHQSRPGEMVRQPVGAAPIFVQHQHASRPRCLR